MDEKSTIDGVSLDDLLPPAPRVKRKEPNNVMDAQTKLKTGMAQAIAPSNRGTIPRTITSSDDVHSSSCALAVVDGALFHLRFSMCSSTVWTEALQKTLKFWPGCSSSTYDLPLEADIV
jgi:hypothetical protein